MKKYVFILLLVWGHVSAGEFVLHINVFNESSMVPGFYDVAGFSCNPGFTAGSEIALYNSEIFRIAQDFDAGFFYHGSGVSQLDIFVTTDTKIAFFFKSGLYIDTFIGVGYFHYLPVEKAYIFNEDGTISKIYSPGIPGLAVSGGLSLGFSFKKVSMAPIDLFFRFHSLTVFNFLEHAVSPVMPSFLYCIGINWYFGGKKQ